jgi:RHS repeat-associated protein
MVVVVNHVPGFSYDGMGNVKVDNLSNNYTCDAEGRPISAAGVQTTFDAFGRATEQNRNNAYTQIVYAPNGQKFAIMNGTTVLGFKAPMAAGMAAVYNGDGTGYFQHADWLGSSRWAQGGGGNVKYDRAYAPFGEIYAESTLGGAFPVKTNHDFTGQTEDTTPGLYDFLFRQQSQSQGRWLAPDPAGLAAVDLTNPQTWNRYAYVANHCCPVRSRRESVG